HWLETLGAASLTVFCAHLVLVLVLLGLLGADYERAWSADLLLLSACLLVLYGVARARLWIKRDGALLSGLLMPRSLSS
ncbi:OpgC domain-containing protein, partial [Acinetobacter baumannii]